MSFDEDVYKRQVRCIIASRFGKAHLPASGKSAAYQANIRSPASKLSNTVHFAALLVIVSPEQLCGASAFLAMQA